MKGFLRRTDTGVLLTLTDLWGFSRELVGLPGEQDGVIGYVLTTSKVTIPDNYKIPLFDDPDA